MRFLGTDMTISIPVNILQTVSQWKSPCILVDVTIPGVHIPRAMEALAQGQILTIDLSTQAPHLRWDRQWRWLSFGSVTDRGIIPAEAVTIAIDATTGAILTAQKLH